MVARLFIIWIIFHGNSPSLNWLYETAQGHTDVITQNYSHICFCSSGPFFCSNALDQSINQIWFTYSTLKFPVYKILTRH